MFIVQFLMSVATAASLDSGSPLPPGDRAAHVEPSFQALLERMHEHLNGAAPARASLAGAHIFGTDEETREMRPEYLAQLLELVRRGVPVETVRELAEAHPRLTFHGIKYLRSVLELDRVHWRVAFRTAQLHCEGRLADQRREAKRRRSFARDKLALEQVVIEERWVADLERRFPASPWAWVPGDRPGLYREWDLYPGFFSELDARARRLDTRTRRQFRSSIRRRGVELRIALLELAERRIDARLLRARQDAERERARFDQRALRGLLRLEPPPLFDVEAARDPARDQALRSELARLRTLLAAPSDPINARP